MKPFLATHQHDGEDMVVLVIPMRSGKLSDSATYADPFEALLLRPTIGATICPLPAAIFGEGICLRVCHQYGYGIVHEPTRTMLTSSFYAKPADAMRQIGDCRMSKDKDRIPEHLIQLVAAELGRRIVTGEPLDLALWTPSEAT